MTSSQRTLGVRWDDVGEGRHLDDTTEADAWTRHRGRAVVDTHDPRAALGCGARVGSLAGLRPGSSPSPFGRPRQNPSYGWRRSCTSVSAADGSRKVRPRPSAARVRQQGRLPGVLDGLGRPALLLCGHPGSCGGCGSAAVAGPGGGRPPGRCRGRAAAASRRCALWCTRRRSAGRTPATVRGRPGPARARVKTKGWQQSPCSGCQSSAAAARRTGGTISQARVGERGEPGPPALPTHRAPPAASQCSSVSGLSASQNRPRLRAAAQVMS